MKHAVLPVISLIIFCSSAFPVDLEGAISGYLPPGTYNITDDIHVPAGQTLTLAPGVVFSFDEGTFEEYEFDVYGTLNAIGTPSQRIVFQAAPGVEEYNYLRITTSSSRLEYCDIMDAGSVSLSGDGGFWIDDCSPVIENSTVSDCSWHGVRITGASACPEFVDCVIEDNENDGVDADDGAGMMLVNCVVRNNGEDGICFSSGENTVIGCVVHNNGEDGLDCNGLTDYPATILNCTIGPHSNETVSDCSEFDMINCVVVAEGVSLGGGTEHTLVMEDIGFFGFQNPGSGNYRLLEGSPLVENGTRFGPAAPLLPQFDIIGNPRVNGIVDIGAVERSQEPPTGEEGVYFSPALLVPRMTRPVIRTRNESIQICIARLGSFSTSDVSATLENPLGETWALDVNGVSHQDMVPGSDLAEVLLYGPGIERVQMIDATVPASVPEDFYGLQVSLDGREYFSVKAVKVVDSYPSEWGFIHITDIHVGYDEEEYTANERLMYCSEEVNILNPEFVVVTGDICEDQNPGTSFVDSLLHSISHYRVPVLLMPGNHDHYNDGSGYYPYAWMRYFQTVSRVMNTEFRFGQSSIFGLNSQYDLGLVELYRCWGPSDAALDWVEASLASGAPAGPLFMAFHGPIYDYFSWNANNVSRVRDIMNAWGFTLGLAGHTHRFETFLNSGTNYLGRNDFSSDDDWVRDVAFPGYPLHVQTSALGKEEHLPYPGGEDLYSMIENRHELGTLHSIIASDEQNGLFGDSIGWRWVQVSGNTPEFFTVDDDGDGYRNTENCWLLGEVQHTVENFSGGVIQSTVANNHFDTWSDIRHFIPAVPGQSYTASGGTILRQHPDGTMEVSVPTLPSQGLSQVILTPGGAGIGGGLTGPSTALHTPSPNPMRATASIRFSTASDGEQVSLVLFDLSGRTVVSLFEGEVQAGEHSLQWNGMDSSGRPAPSGIYFCRMTAGTETRTEEFMLIR